MFELSTSIAEYIRIPAVLQNVINTANSDLYHGPIYIDTNGNHVSCFDEYHHAFDFARATGIIAAWFNNMPGELYYEEWSGCILESEPDWYEDPETGEMIPPDSYYVIDRPQIAECLFGRELAAYVQ